MAPRLRVSSAAREYVSTTIKKGSHVLAEGSLLSTTYERGNGKGKKAKANKQSTKAGGQAAARLRYYAQPSPD